MKGPRSAIACLLLAALAGPLSAQSNGPLVLPSTLLEEVRVAPPLRLAEEPLASPLAELPAAVFAARREMRELQEWNDRGRMPVRAGFARALSEARVVALDSTVADGEIREHAGGLLAARAGAAVWGGGVRVEEAWRLRLHLADAQLPQGARLWVYGANGEVAGPFGEELKGPDGGLWTPSVEGPEIRLEVEVPRGKAARFTVDQVGEIVASGLRATVAADEGCFIDGKCVDRNRFPGVDLVRKALAQLVFASEGSFFICTGGLVNDTDTKTVIPYLLTANHCISTQAEAASVEATWDYMRAQCNGPFPAFGRLPRSFGASVVMTGASSDHTLLRLNRIPGGRALLGWSAVPVTEGTRLYRLSHPGYDGPGAFVYPQIFAETEVDLSLPQSNRWPRPRFIYARQVSGGMWGGSSGSPVLLSNGQIVGQLTGGVHPSETPEACDFRSGIVDGALSASFASLRGFLDPPAPCRPGPDTLCLLNNRFRVKVSYQNQFDGSSGTGRPIPRSNISGFFSFGDPSNVELLVKILDFGDVVKVFWGQLTNLRYNLEVMDTRTGQIQNYTNTAGDCGGIDQNFAASVLPSTAPKSMVRAAGTCRSGPSTLCLLQGRFAVEVDWRNQANNTSGQGGAAALSNVTGTFTFGDRSNVELMVKMLNFGDRVALFWGALSDLEYTLKVTDTETGQAKTYRSTAGRLCGGLDINAF
jgi:hypothetical protein